MKKIFISIAVIIILAGVGVVGALYTKIWNPMWNPFRPKPEVVLSEMALKMKELKSFHVDGDFSLSEYGNTVDSEAFLDIDRASKDNPKIKGRVKIPIYLVDVEFIRADNKNLYLDSGISVSYLEYYLREVLGEERFSKEIGVIQNKWLKINKKTIENFGNLYLGSGMEEKAIPEISQEQQKQLAEEIIKLFIGRKFYEVKEELPDQEIDGQMFYHYLVALNQEEIKAVAVDVYDTIAGQETIINSLESYFGHEITPSDVAEDRKEVSRAVDDFFEKIGEVVFDVWISQKDNHLYRVKFAKENTGEGKGSILVDVKFSKFNSVEEIKAPEEFVDMEPISEIIVQEIEKSMKESRARAGDVRRDSARARDSERVGEVNALRDALQLYYIDHRRFPTSTDNESDWCYIEERDPASSHYCPYLEQELIPKYIKELPKDPLYPKTEGSKIYAYRYKSISSGSGYTLRTDLETKEPFIISTKGGSYFTP